jgi:hypothetical protein
VDVTASCNFLPTVPERKPLRECGCQPVVFMESTNKCTWGAG